jgi:hypothetical protein
MATEDLTGTDKFVDDLVATNPVATDSVSDGDEHIRGVKNVLKNTLPNVTAAVTATAADLNKTSAITTATTDPLGTSNQAVGHFWINSTSGEAFICTDATTGLNRWANVGYGEGSVSHTAVMSGGTETQYTQDGTDYRSHTFTSSGNLVVSYGGAAEVLVVGGGGGGGAGHNAGGGGGGAGQVYKSGVTESFDVGTLSVTVGAGGASPPGPQQTGYNGSASALSSVATAIGGGAGGAGFIASKDHGLDGGSGGGGGIGVGAVGGSAISGGTNYHGNDGASAPSSSWAGAKQSGGGGGAGTAANGAAGGSGLQCSFINGTSVYYGGGGGGGGDPTRGVPGTGGGGYGYNTGVGAESTAGAVNSGGGGGGGGNAPVSGSNEAGGSGIVIVRYAI